MKYTQATGKEALRVINMSPEDRYAAGYPAYITEDALRESGVIKVHPLAIPGELLAEACNIGRPSIVKYRKAWEAIIFMSNYEDYSARGQSPTEALQAVIDKAVEAPPPGPENSV